MTLLNKFPVTTLPNYIIEKIAENTIEREDKLVTIKANLSAKSIGPFIDALRRNPYLSQNNNLL